MEWIELTLLPQRVLNSYVIELEQSGLKPATVSRSVASMKAFFHYEELEQRTSADPAFELKAPKVEKKAQLF